MTTKSTRLVILDGHSILYRSFFAIQNLSAPDGTPTNAVYGFANMLLRVLEDLRPTHVLVTFDSGRRTFRTDIYEGYKANRKGSSPEMHTQFALAEELIHAFGIRSWKKEGYESDDLVGSVTKEMENVPNIEIYVVTGDRDLFQLVSEKTSVVYMKKGVTEVDIHTPGTVREYLGIEPSQIADLKSLQGDSSDNIPGVAGIGEKTARKLISEFGSLENVYASLHLVPENLRKKLEEGKDSAFLSKRLATICRDVPQDFGLDDMRYSGPDKGKLAELFSRLGFRSLMKRMDLKPPETRAPEGTWCVLDESRTEEFAESLKNTVFIQVEAEGENPHRARLVGISFHAGERTYFLPYGTNAGAWKVASAWLADPKTPKCMHDSHRAKIVLEKLGIRLAGVEFDTHVAAYLTDPVRGTWDFSRLAEHLGVTTLHGEQDVTTHSCTKAKVLPDISSVLSRELEKKNLTRLYEDVELPLVDVLVGCETAGIRLDRKGLQAYGQEIRRNMEALENSIYEKAGKKFSINSPKQLSAVLFGDLGLPATKRTQTGFSTDAEALESIRNLHPIVEDILEYKKWANLHSRFVEGLLAEIHEDGKIHTFYNVAQTATGRLSSQFPNMQNIPVRTEEGRHIRKFFVPSEGYDFILCADYSQIELRILAHLSRDPEMVRAFERGEDIHERTASDLFGVSPDKIDAEMRRVAKAVNFGILYGISDFGLAANLKIPKKEAKEFIDRYFSLYPRVKSFLEETVREARKNGYVSTILGRMRYVPDLRSPNFAVRKAAERIAMNTPIQGSAADIIKLAMISLYNRFAEKGLRSRMLLQVHDELVFEVAKDELDEVVRTVREGMENAIRLSVPLRVDVGFGNSWYDAK